MSYNTFPTLQGRGWPDVVTPTWNTARQTSVSGKQFNVALRSAAVHKFQVPINYLSPTDYSTLLAFYNGQQGGAIPFYFTPSNGSTYLVTFADDSVDFTQFLNNMFKTGTLNLVEFP